MSTLATAAPEGSVTLPFSWLVDCAKANEAKMSNTANSPINRLQNDRRCAQNSGCCPLLACRSNRVIAVSPRISASAGELSWEEPQHLHPPRALFLIRSFSGKELHPQSGGYYS